jgi:hypothetical protein
MDKITRETIAPKAERQYQKKHEDEELDFLNKVKQYKNSPETRLAIEINEKNIHLIALKLLEDNQHKASKIPYELLEHFAYENKIEIPMLKAACEIIEEENKH